MDFGALPPEINSARMYAGPGPGSMLAAAAAWDGLAAQLHSGAAAYMAVISGLTNGPWLGPSSTAMAAAAAPYGAWMSTTAGQAELSAIQAQAAAAAYETAFAMTVPPPMIAANRAQLTSLVATNFLGQNTPAIAATEAQYSEMWAQDAAAMYGYAANSAATTAKVTPFTPAPQTANPAGLVTQGATGAQVAGTSTGTGVQSTLSQLVSTVPTTLQSLASPTSTASSTSGLSGLLSGLGGSSSGSVIPGLGGSLLQNYATLPGWFGIEVAGGLLNTLFQPISTALTPAAATAADAAGAVAADGATAGTAAADGAAAAADLGAGAAAADLGGVAASVGALSVPPTWGWAATGLPPMFGSVQLAAPLAAGGTDLGAGFGFPFMFPPGAAGRTATAGVTGAVAGAAAAKYLPRMSVVGRSPGAGESEVPPLQKVPIPTNGHAPPGYRAAVVYLPSNGHEPANV